MADIKDENLTVEYAREFKETRRKNRKLSLAICGLKDRESFADSDISAMLDYLKSRKRSAMQEMIEEGDLTGIRIFGEYGWIEEKYLSEYKYLASQFQEIEVWAYLCKYGNDTEEKVRRSVSINSKADLAKRAFGFVKNEIIKMLPSFAAAFSDVDLTEDEDISYLAFDGKSFVYNADAFLRSYADDSVGLRRDLLHCILHAIYFHPLIMEGKDKRLFNICCDIFVERVLDSWNVKGLSQNRRDYRALALKECHIKEDYKGINSLYEAVVKLNLKESFILKLEREFTVDDHDIWKKFLKENKLRKKEKKGSGDGEGGISDAASFANKWSTIKEEVDLDSNKEGKKAGTSAGSARADVSVIKKQEYDYRGFLSEFMTCKEEVEIDLDSFDYIPYLYSMDHYDGMLIMEPLEYKEMNKLDEMIIAIDTSGSCSGKIVKKFLEETWNIITEKGNFFKNMNVHIIQCDSMIQEHIVIHSHEEFENYMDNVKVNGLGGTDFRPVFDLANKMIKEKKLNNLKGLLYFTDGDGIYPPAPPEFTTAFIYLNKQYEKMKPPEWALSLNLGLKMEEE